MNFVKEVDGKKYSYEESIWTGKKTLKIDGYELVKLDKKTFSFQDAETSYRLTIEGNFLSGIKLRYEDGKEVVLCKNAWYEWILIFLPLLGFGLGIFGGAIGGALSAVFCIIGAYVNANILRTRLVMPLKILCCIGVFIAANAAWFGIYTAIVGGIASVFPLLFS